jgi:RNA polymerase sigma factor (sigma-70 family)
MRTYPEEELIPGIRDHSSEILEYIYCTCFPVIENYILHNNGNHEQAEDVFQEAMIIIYDRIRNRDLTLSCKFNTYLYAICKNIWIQERKKYLLHVDRLRHQPMEVHEPDPDEDPVLSRHLDELFNRHFGQLSEDCRTILSMFFNNYTIEEIRERMNYKDLHHTADRKYRCKKSLIRRIIRDPLFKRLKDEIR